MKNRFLFNSRTGYVLRTRRKRYAEALCIALGILSYLLLLAYMGKSDELADMALQLRTLEMRYVEVAASSDAGCLNTTRQLALEEVGP